MLPLSKWDKLPFSNHIIGRSTSKRIIYHFEINYIKFENTVIKICFHIKEANRMITQTFISTKRITIKK